MALLNDFRRMFARKQQIAIDLRSSQAAGLLDHDETPTTIETTSQTTNGSPATATAATATPGTPGTPATPVAVVESKPLAARPGRHRRSRAQSQAELERACDEVISLAGCLREHLDSQAERTTRLLEVLERVPRALDALPEISRQHVTLLELLSEHLTTTRRREETLAKTLQRLDDSSTRQAEALGLINRQMEGNTQAVTNASDNLAEVYTALRELAESNHRAATLVPANAAASATESPRR